MFELAAAYVGTYLGKKLLDRVGDDVGDAFDAGLRKLYDWVKGKLASRAGNKALAQVEKDPDGDGQRDLLAAMLEDAVEGDTKATAELSAMIAELDKLRPPGLVIRGSAESAELHGKQAGARVSGQVPAGSSIDATAKVSGTVHEGAENVGVEYRGGG